nr:MAG TPA: hypothetical protein [Caudoviricetes sp.]DAV71242.1 MAG TPA: hypothetical protein [Caudoviricetes sp.]
MLSHVFAAVSCAGRGGMTNHIFIYIVHVYLLERGEAHVV